jgi:hypothetical protein
MQHALTGKWTLYCSNKRNTWDTRGTQILPQLLCDPSRSWNNLQSKWNDPISRQWCSLPSGTKIKESSIRIPLSRKPRWKTIQWSNLYISKNNQISHAIGSRSRIWYMNAKEAVPMRITLEELNHPHRQHQWEQITALRMVSWIKQ